MVARICLIGSIILLREYPDFLGNNINRIFPEENYTAYETYSGNHSMELEYWFVSDNLEHKFTYNVSCNNTAQLSASQEYIVTVRLNQQIQITQVTPGFVSARDIDYQIKTSITALSCSLSLNGDDLGSMDRNSNTNFTLPVVLDLGSNNMQVTCQAGNSSS